MESKDNNKTIKFIAIVEFIIIVLLLLSRSNRFNFKLNLGYKEIRLADVYETTEKDINGLKLDLYSTDVEIKESKDEVLKIEYYTNTDNNDKIRVEDNIVVLKEEASTVACFGICNSMRKVIVHIPSEYALSYNIVTMSGDIKSYIDLVDSDIDISTKSGDIALNKIDKANIVTTSGDISIKEANVLDIVTTSGDTKIDKISDNFKINTTSGNTRIVDLEIKSNSSINTTSGDIVIKNNKSNCYVDFNTKSGDDHISKSDRKSDIVLSVKTTSGDIRVN